MSEPQAPPARASGEIDATLLASEPGEAPPPSVSIDASPADWSGSSQEQRYLRRGKLGEGGMGEVWLSRDRRMGRDVAVKSIRSGFGTRSDARSRFEREARIQGQLEHPSVVPVYDLGARADGSVYFTMKRVVGHTLEEVLDGLRSGSDEALSKYTRHKLLSAFATVCLAVEFAHQRGVIHRDLKPSNLILGEFGEIYVLDWGVAKLLDDDEVPAMAATAEALEVDEASATPRTEAGSMIGTPGFMAPEQACGEPGTIDRRSDVYALGTILFEILTLEPLHRGASLEELLTSTLRGADARPSARKAEMRIPAELDAICASAAALEPGDRFASARALHDAIEAFLDGSRDRDRRRQMAKAHVATAKTALVRAEARPETAAAEHARAVRELNSALLLDPTDGATVHTLVRVLLESMEQLPPEAELELERSQQRGRARVARRGLVGYLACVAAVPLFFWMGVRSHPALIFTGSCLFVAAAYVAWLGARPELPKSRHHLMALLSALVAGSTCTLFGPFVMVPAMVVATAFPFLVNMRAGPRLRAVTMAAGALAVLLPTSLQWLGLLPTTYAYQGDTMTILAWAIQLPPGATMLLLLLLSLAVIILPVLILGSGLDSLARAERRIFAQAWHLRQLVPDEARGAAAARLTMPESEMR